MSVFNDAQRPDSGFVTITGEEGGKVTCLLNGDVDYSDPVGGWEPVERVGQQSAAWYKSQPLATMSIPLSLHVDATGGDIDRQLKVLAALGKPSGATGDDPGPVQVIGDVPSPPAMLWRLDSLKRGPCLYQPENPAVLLSQDFTVELTQIAKQTTVSRASARSARTKAGKKKTRTVKARKNDTIRAIAVRELGNSADYVLIRKWNAKLKRVDPDARLRAGTKVVLR